MSVRKDPSSAFVWVVIALVIIWRAVRAARGEFSQKERLGGFKPTCYTQTIVKVAKQERDMSPKEVWKNLYHQIRWVRSKQEEKEIKRNKIPTQLKPEKLKEAQKKYIAWKVGYLREFLKDR